MIAVLNPTIFAHSGSCKIFVCNAQNSLASRQRDRLDYSHRIREHIIAISSIRCHYSGGRHYFLIVILRIDNQDDISQGSRLTGRINSQQRQQSANSIRSEIVYSHGCFFGIYASGYRYTFANLSIHADGLIIAVAGYDSIFQTVCQCFIQYLSDKIIQPDGAKIQHGFTNWNKRGQFQ